MVKISVGENEDEDLRYTMMDPNTRTLIKTELGDIENDMEIFQLIRGGTAADLAGRKKMMHEYHIDKNELDL